MSDHQPYTYLIGWSKLDRWYYGVRYAKNCVPGDLWKTYFTSSKLIQKHRQKHGEPDVIEIRKIFNSSKKAIEWEHKVLRRLKVVHNRKWLNLAVSPPNRDELKRGYDKIRGKTYEEFMDPDKIKKRRSTLSRSWNERGYDQATIDRMRYEASQRNKNRLSDPIERAKMNRKKNPTEAYKEAAARRWTDPAMKEHYRQGMIGKPKIKRVCCSRCRTEMSAAGFGRHQEKCFP